MEEIVYGMNKFKEYFKDFSDKYIIVGGTATAVHLKEQALTARVTKDIDMIYSLVVHLVKKRLYL